MSRPTRMFNRNFVLLWQGQFVSNLGNQAFLIAIVFWIKDATGSATLMGLILMLSALPAVVLGPIGGAIADRHSRRMIIMLSDLLSGLAVLVLAALMWLTPTQTDLIIAWIFITATLLGIIDAFFSPAMTAALPDLVPEERVAGANSVGQLALELSTLLGQALGGLLFRLLGAPLLMLTNALTFIFSAVSEAFIRIPQHLPDQPAHWRERIAVLGRDLRAGLSFIWGIRGLRGLVLLSTLGNFFNVPIIVLLPFYVEDFLGLAPDWYGYLLAAFSAGTMAGYLIAGAAPLSPRLRAGLALTLMVLEPICYIAVVLTGAPPLALVLVALAGAMSGFMIVIITTLLQIATPSELRGRVFGLIATLSGTLAPIAMGLAGIVADLSGQRIPLIYLGCSVAMLVMALLALLSPSIRAFLAYDHPGHDEPAPPVPPVARPSPAE
jgi:MFS transporter, DHA3 family, macrolide efflux protein